jgi:hypothetical protein
MMKFLYGLVLLVAILPLSAADNGYGISIDRLDYDDGDCTASGGAVDASILAAIQTCTAIATDGDLDLTPVKVTDGIRRALRRKLGRSAPDCSDPCMFEVCCIFHQAYCGCGDCGCNRRDLEFLDSGETSRELTPQGISRKLTPEEEAIESLCASTLQTLANSLWAIGNTCLGDPDQLFVSAVLTN